MRLQEAATVAFCSARATSDLMQELKGSFGSPRVAVGQSKISVDDADQVELRKVVALGDHLSADDDVDVAVGHRFELLAHALETGDEVARKHQHARAGE